MSHICLSNKKILGLLVLQWCREHNIFVNMWYLSFSIISYTVCMHMCVFILLHILKSSSARPLRLASHFFPYQISQEKMLLSCLFSLASSMAWLICSAGPNLMCGWCSTHTWSIKAVISLLLNGVFSSISSCTIMTLLSFTCVILCEDRMSWISCFKFHHIGEGILFWVFLDLRAWLRVILYIASIGLAGRLNSSKRTLHNRAFTFSHSRSFSALFL